MVVKGRAVCLVGMIALSTDRYYFTSQQIDSMATVPIYGAIVYLEKPGAERHKFVYMVVKSVSHVWLGWSWNNYYRLRSNCDHSHKEALARP